MNGWLITWLLARYRRRLGGAKVAEVGRITPEGMALLLEPGAGDRLLVLITTPVGGEALAVVPETELPSEISLSEPRGGWLAGMAAREVEGGYLEEVIHKPFSRIVHLAMVRYDRYGRATRRSLVMELTGKHANCFLLSERGMIMAMMRKVRVRAGGRELRTGVAYREPQAPERLDPLNLTAADLAGQAAGAATVEEVLLGRVRGMDRELAGLIAQGVNLKGRRAAELRAEEWDLLADTVSELALDTLAGGDRLGQLYGVPDLGALLLGRLAEVVKRFGPGGEKPEGEDKEREEEAIFLKLGRLTFASAEEVRGMMGRLSQIGEEIQIRLGQGEEEEWQGLVEKWAKQTGLDRLFRPDRPPEKLHAKLQGLIAELDRRLREAEKPSPPPSPPPSQTKEKPTAEQAEVMDEAVRRTINLSRRLRERGIPHRIFITSEGFPLVVGTGRESNQKLYQHFRSGNHLWFHARDWPGSHVILVCGKKQPGERSMIEAAVVAAYFSQGGRESTKEVRYTRMKNLYRTKGLPPGTVLIREERVMVADPKEFELMKKELTVSRN